MHDTLVKAWALWGDYLESLFTRERLVSHIAKRFISLCAIGTLNLISICIKKLGELFLIIFIVF